jgi:uncharacterized protein (TIGR02594 family)
MLLCSAALAAWASPAFAKPVHRHRHHAAPQAVEAPISGVQDNRYPWLSNEPEAKVAPTRRVRHGRRVAAAQTETEADGGFSSSSLVGEARKYLGTNPTGRRSLWCGAFMDMVLRRTGHPGGGNLALGYEHYGTRVSGPEVGAIAVMGRHGGGHVGVVSGIDASGNPIIVSGNHNHTVAEAVYPRSRIAAYVMPGG